MKRIDIPSVENAALLPEDKGILLLLAGCFRSALDLKLTAAERQYVESLTPNWATITLEETKELVVKLFNLMHEKRMNFSSNFGGELLVCETEEDLKEIQVTDFEFSQKHDRWPDVTDCPIEVDYMARSETWAMLFIATNNSGGPSYLVPQHLWEAAKMEEQFAFNAIDDVREDI